MARRRWKRAAFRLWLVLAVAVGFAQSCLQDAEANKFESLLLGVLSSLMLLAPVGLVMVGVAWAIEGLSSDEPPPSDRTPGQ
jgi:hypothetical protein